MHSIPETIKTGTTFKMVSQRTATLTLFLSFLSSLVLPASFAASGGRMGGGSFSTSSLSFDEDERSSSYYHSHDYHHHHHYGVYEMYDAGRGSSSFQNVKQNEGRESDGFSVAGVSVFSVFVLGTISFFVYRDYLKNRGSVIVVQIGVQGKSSSLQRELNEIAKTTDTSSLKGWRHILRESTLALLRHPDNFISGHASVKSFWSTESVEKRFKKLVLEEREKFDMESLTNVNNVKRQKVLIPKASKLGKSYMVVTVLLAAKGLYTVPTVQSADDMEDTLRSLHTSADKLLAIEVFWTPQDENDTLSEEEFLENYPLLKPI
ncbi:hypothetical protein K2173_021616 [Erythroxylum novogranatense]|uniref:Uncharacterized protein n=1 Tax=Erythroxylum novogranatense TaxID=1862640 RepID=A0AAV8TNV4_9ROSI|nr:hypothetical protein K2173_021616 [Erythroxylum novogranatense]